jgi:dTMP kinase
LFVTFEGVGGAGKTTQTELLGTWLREQGYEVESVREPGGTPIGEELRRLVLYGPDVAPWTEAGLFATARAELVEKVIRPAIERGRFVIADRYVDSSLAYQGVDRRLGVDPIFELNLRLTGGLMPDRTFLLLVDVDEAHARRLKIDRVEPEDHDRLVRLDTAYRELAERFPERIVPIEAGGSTEEVADLVRGELQLAT